MIGRVFKKEEHETGGVGVAIRELCMQQIFHCTHTRRWVEETPAQAGSYKASFTRFRPCDRSCERRIRLTSEAREEALTRGVAALTGRVYFFEQFERKGLLSKYTDLCIAGQLHCTFIEQDDEDFGPPYRRMSDFRPCDGRKCGERIILDENAVARAMAFVDKVIAPAL